MDNTYLLITLKFALGMLCLILQINLLGKGNLAPASALDQVQNYILGAIIGGIIYDNDISIVEFILVLLIWTVIVLILRYIKEHNRWVRIAIDGQPQLLIKNGHVFVDNCIRSGMSANDLMFRLRSQGIYEVARVKSGILEQNGQLVVIENNEHDVKFPLISDGQLNTDILELIHRDAQWVEQQITAAGYHGLDDIYLGEYLHGELRLVGYPKR